MSAWKEVGRVFSAFYQLLTVVLYDAAVSALGHDVCLFNINSRYYSHKLDADEASMFSLQHVKIFRP